MGVCCCLIKLPASWLSPPLVPPQLVPMVPLVPLRLLGRRVALAL